MSSGAPSRLNDFDWSCKVAVASSSVSKMKDTNLTLKMNTTSEDGFDKDVIVELSKKELDALLGEMAKIDAKTIELMHKK